MIGKLDTCTAWKDYTKFSFLHAGVPYLDAAVIQLYFCLVDARPPIAVHAVHMLENSF